MSLPSLSIRRPVLAFMLSAVLVIFGVISYFRIGVQANPNITFPVITVTTLLPGGNPSVVNEMISKPIEKAVNSIAGIESINSDSSAGKSSVQIKFKLGEDINAAFNEVSSRLNQARADMPSGTKPSTISKASISAQPIMLLTLYGNRPLMDLSDIARNTIKINLENISGVAQVNIEGVSKKVVRINLDLAKMAAMGVTLDEVQRAFSSQHVQIPGGYLVSGNKQYAMNIDMEFHSIKNLEDMIIAYRHEAPIFLKSIATINMGLANKRQLAIYNGKSSVGISIVKKSGANTVAIVNDVKSHLKQIQQLLPSGVKIAVVYEQAHYILDVVHELEQDAWLSILAAGLVIFLFLKSFRSTLIIVTAIPVSLLGVVMAIYFFGYTFNVVTLLGIILLVGVVVDDAIVVLENSFRCLTTKAMDRMTAATEGAQQVVFAVLASSLTLVSIFLPVIFIGGVIGLFFRSFAIVVSTGVIISLFVSLTLTPMLCSRYLKAHESQGWLYNFLERGFVCIDNIYKAILYFALRFRWTILLMAILIVLAAIPVFHSIGKAFMPTDRNSGHFTIIVQAPQGSSTAYTKSRINEVESVLAKYPQIKSYYTNIEPANIGTVTVRLIPRDQWKQSQMALVQKVKKQLEDIAGVICFVNNSVGGSSLSFEVRGEDYNRTAQVAFQFQSELNKHPELGTVYIHMSPSAPSFQVTVDRILANSVGLSPQTIGNALMVLGGGVKVAKFNSFGQSQRHEVMLRTDSDEFVNPKNISHIYLRGKKDQLVRLDTIAGLEASVMPVKITRTDLNYSVGLSANPTIPLNKSIQLVQQIATKTLPKGYQLKMTGSAASLSETVDHVIFAVALILLLMYMILASQFNSFIQPIIIMLALPLAIIGGVLMLWITGQTLNIYSMIGLLLLMGLVAKNSILLIDLTNELRKQGKTIKDALTQSCPQRMRPVVMTSLAIILAMVPAAIMGGADASTHRPLALVIIGGMISSTLLTLIVVPAVYSLVENGLERLKKKPDIA